MYMVVGLYLDSRATGEQARTHTHGHTAYGVHTHIAAYAIVCLHMCTHRVASRRVASRRVGRVYPCVCINVSRNTLH